MPFCAPGSLSQTEYMQLTVFLLERNGIVPVEPASIPLQLPRCLCMAFRQHQLQVSSPSQGMDKEAVKLTLIEV